ncbi:hypothetical protein C7I55_08300 [Sphingomonas deserti]|uniref:PNPLA domain-containing protein n=2 Tax=Allosphingosinicella deserti TaxID=2116704 RepID=A0A2P7QW85_9SPHN|nr:hypothetical protein C7I55_08300 [Sphingomonas deserti]
MSVIGSLIRFVFGGRWGKKRQLFYFEDILPYELAAINERRARKQSPKGPVVALESGDRPEFGEPRAPIFVDWLEGSDRYVEAQHLRKQGDEYSRRRAGPEAEPRSPDPGKLFFDASTLRGGLLNRSSVGTSANPGGHGGAGVNGAGDGHRNGGLPPNYFGFDGKNPDKGKMRPRPVPCTATGLALSGGGIRSAAVCLGALQALDQDGRLDAVDYLSTVSGGGYIGASASAALSRTGGGHFPFGGDVADTPELAHLRNYSNYLMPRGRSRLRNVGEVVVLVLRGLVANLFMALSFLLLAAGLSLLLLPLLGANPWAPVLWSAAALAVLLLVWAALRAVAALDWLTGDTRGALLRSAHALLLAGIALAFIAAQPGAVQTFRSLLVDRSLAELLLMTNGVGPALATLAALVSAFSGAIGRYLETSRRSRRVRTFVLRGASQLALAAASLVLPLALWCVFLWLCATASDNFLIRATDGLARDLLSPASRWPSLTLLTRVQDSPAAIYLALGLAGVAGQVALTPNAYSLHRLYRDRLSKAFLFKSVPGNVWREPKALDGIKLSDLAASNGPYPIINAAMNVQGSAEANRRGRDADFFIFTPGFVGSDLTSYAAAAPSGIAAYAGALHMERIDPRLDLATAMAISGAAISANMGSSTVRLMSPTLALLNVRLGYWMINPRSLAGGGKVSNALLGITRGVYESLFLLREMLNLHDERSSHIVLTDGGHIENLGLYELLKRGCELIVAIDAEADPTLSFGSLLKLERYARIDLGVRIVLPWEEMAEKARKTSEDILAGTRTCEFGPHCAVGRIIYQNGSEGILLYFKSTLTGDEKDYVIDYKKRNADFPHETTGDQFFTEEQFEMYRALGFHMVSGFLDGSDEFVCTTRWRPNADADALRQRILSLLPRRHSGTR